MEKLRRCGAAPGLEQASDRVHDAERASFCRKRSWPTLHRGHIDRKPHMAEFVIRNEARVEGEALVLGLVVVALLHGAQRALRAVVVQLQTTVLEE